MMAEYDIEQQVFTFFNFPLISFNITANIFYAWSFFMGRGKLKQPLNVLLGYLLLCTMMYCASLIGVSTAALFSHTEFFLVWIILGQNTQCSMTCYVLLNFYYYMSIVPAKHGVMVWTKKNLKLVIYVALTGGTMLYLVYGILRWMELSFEINTNNNQTGIEWSGEFHDIKYVFTMIIQVYIFLCMWIMMVSSFSTVHYLGKHIRNFTKSSSRLTSRTIQSQIRVTIVGLLQGLLYLFYYIFYLTYLLMFSFDLQFFLGSRVFMSVTTVFFSATTVNIGISQNVVRQRAADVFRGLKALIR